MDKQTPWTYEQAQAQLAELLTKAANGQPQRVVLPDGSVMVVLATQSGQIHPPKS